MIKLNKLFKHLLFLCIISKETICGYLSTINSVSPETVNSISTYSFTIYSSNIPISGSIQITFAPQINTTIGNASCTVVKYFLIVVIFK